MKRNDELAKLAGRAREDLLKRDREKKAAAVLRVPNKSTMTVSRSEPAVPKPKPFRR